jgi:hypothetical protein
VVELVHPKVLVRLLALRHAKDVTLIKSNHKGSKRKHSEQYAYGQLWYAGGHLCNQFAK